MNKKLIAAAAAAAAFASGAVYAQSGFYAGAELGAATLKDESTDIAKSLVAAVGGSASVTQDRGLGFARLFGGYNFNKYVAAELGYVQSGYATANFSGVSGGAVPYSGNIKISISGFDIAAIIRPAADSAAKGLFLRLGVSSYTNKADATVTAGGVTGISSASKSGTGTNLGIGYDLPVGPGEVRFSYTNMSSVAGISGADTDAFSVGYLWKF